MEDGKSHIGKRILIINDHDLATHKLTMAKTNGPVLLVADTDGLSTTSPTENKFTPDTNMFSERFDAKNPVDGIYKSGKENRRERRAKKRKKIKK